MNICSDVILLLKIADDVISSDQEMTLETCKTNKNDCFFLVSNSYCKSKQTELPKYEILSTKVGFIDVFLLTFPHYGSIWHLIERYYLETDLFYSLFFPMMKLNILMTRNITCKY